jgi:hypothetical protein
MADSVPFPLFIFEKDDCSMFLIEAPNKVLHQMEAIDIENDEYLCWDANGQAVKISVSGNRVARIEHGSSEMSLSEGLNRHSVAFGLDVDMTGPAQEVWHRFKEAEAKKPRKSGLLSKIFGRNRP